MKYYLSLMIFTMTNFSSFAQTMEGYVIDKHSKEKLVFVNIVLNNDDLGTYTNIDGRYKLELNDETRSDTLIVSMIGYKTIKFPINKIKRIQNFKLIKDIEYLDEITLNIQKIKYGSKKTLGTNKKIGTFKSSSPFGYEQAIKVLNNKKGKILKLKLSLKKNKIKNSLHIVKEAFFRISFYKEDEEGFPGEYIYKKDIIVKPDNILVKKTIDLSNLNILFPNKNFFIGIEVINPKKKNPTIRYYRTSPLLVFTHTKTPVLYSRYRKKEWNKNIQNSIFKKKYYTAPLISLIVKRAK